IDIVDFYVLVRGVADAHLRQGIDELPQACAAADRVLGVKDNVARARIGDVVDEDIGRSDFAGGPGGMAGAVVDAGIDRFGDFAAAADQQLDFQNRRAAGQNRHVRAEGDALRIGVVYVAVRSAAGKRPLARVHIAVDADAGGGVSAV